MEQFQLATQCFCKKNSIKIVIELLKYHEHKWVICVDLKIINLLGQKKGFIKFPCYICVWDSRTRDKHWTQKEWPCRETLKACMPNIVNDLIVNWERIIFPLLHLKLGLMKQFVKALSTEGECFQHIVSAFPIIYFVFWENQSRCVRWARNLCPCTWWWICQDDEWQGEGSVAVFCCSHKELSW